MKTVFNNKYFRIVSVNTYYVLQTKGGGNDRYFFTLQEAYKAIGKGVY
jgi:hypothetical protein